MKRTIQGLQTSEFFWAFTVTVACLVLIAIITSCTETKIVEVEKIIEKQVDPALELHTAGNAKAFLAEEVEKCGAGVIQGAKDEQGNPIKSECGYSFKVDREFIKNHQERTGLIHDPELYQHAGVTFYEPIHMAVPEDFDLRDLMKKGWQKPKQQQCGDCWAWSTHHALEIILMLNGKLEDRSVQTVLSCSGTGTCRGGTMATPNFLVRSGVPMEDEYPYRNGVTGSCPFSSSELASGWDPKAIDAPYIGNSMMYSRGALNATQRRDGSKLAMRKAAIFQNKSPLVSTVAAYSISGDGVYDRCSAINSGGDHMVVEIGWDGGNQHVYNSWGPGHGKDGVSRIQAECGEGRLNRGLGVSSRVVMYKPSCTPPGDVAFEKPEYMIISGSALKLGSKQPAGVKCAWTPTTGVADPNACETFVSPERTTEYHLAATNDCGTTSAMTTVRVLSETTRMVKDDTILTPFGVVVPIRSGDTVTYQPYSN